MSAQAPQQTTARISIRPQTIREAYDPPANVLEIDVINPETHGLGNKRYTDYEVRLRVIPLFWPFCCPCLQGFCLTYFFLLAFQTNLPVFKTSQASVRRRFSDFEWLRNELERGSKVNSRLR
jgi:sorting nexin-3/12